MARDLPLLPRPPCFRRRFFCEHWEETGGHTAGQKSWPGQSGDICKTEKRWEREGWEVKNIRDITFASPSHRLRLTVRIGCAEGRAWIAIGWSMPSTRGKRRP